MPVPEPVLQQFSAGILRALVRDAVVLRGPDSVLWSGEFAIGKNLLLILNIPCKPPIARTCYCSPPLLSFYDGRVPAVSSYKRKIVGKVNQLCPY